MSDREGLLTLPITEVTQDPATEAVGDPLLDVLARFLQAAINNDTKLGWAVVHPLVTPPHSVPLPVAFIETHSPTDHDFNSVRLPALFVWRESWPKLLPYTQDWKAQVSNIAVMWVPPLGTHAQEAMREPFRNAIAKAIHRNLERCRNPGWFVAGDTEAKAALYGSFLMSHANLAKLQCLNTTRVPVTVHKGVRDEQYDGLLTLVEVTELLIPVLDDFYADGGSRGTYKLGASPLTIVSAEFKPTLLSVTPSTGPAAGGTAITLRGSQFWEDDFLGTPTATINDVACTSVVLVDETTITATTPAGAVGARTVKVTMPNGTSASLTSAFTYV